jgi:3-isopropylmalate/(R)-2-methylmalate dehydratase small subunit
MVPMKGKAICVGDNIDTDAIIPGRYCISFREDDLGPHLFEGIDPSLKDRVKPGDFIVAGSNFGCGSAREHAVIAMRSAGVAAVIAKSFSRTFFRNAINVALPVLESEDAEQIHDGDLLEIDLSHFSVRNLTRGKEYSATPYPDYVQQIMDSGGMVEFARKKLKGK